MNPITALTPLPLLWSRRQLPPCMVAASEPQTPLVMPSDAELAARLGLLEERLEAQRPTALAWQYGWTGFYVASLAANVVLRGTGRRRRRPGARHCRRGQVGARDRRHDPAAARSPAGGCRGSTDARGAG